MIKRFLSIFLLIFLYLSCSKTSPQPVVVEGKVLGADGKIPILAHVNITKPGNSIFKPDHFMQVDDSGHFKIQLPRGNYWRVTCTAVNHQAYSFPLITDEIEHDIFVTIRLSPNTPKSNLSEIAVIGGWNNWRFSQAIKMERENDGTYSLQLENGSDSLSYQVINVIDKDRAINGTDASYYEYDGEGDYLSVKIDNQKKHKIVFNPNALSQNSNSGIPTATLADSGTSAQKIISLFDEFLTLRASISDKDINSIPQDIRMALNMYKEKIKSILDKSNSASLKQAAALKAAEILMVTKSKEDKLITDIINNLAATDTLWAYEPTLLLPFYRWALGADSAGKYLSECVENIPDRLAQGMVFVDLGFQARKNNDFKRHLEIHKLLYYNFSDIYVLRPYIDELDPRKANIISKPVPRFNFPVFGEDRFLSNDDLKGSYYLLFFWSRYQEECLAEMSFLHEAHDKFKNLKIVGVNFDPFPKDLESFREKYWPLPWINSQPRRDQQKYIMNELNVRVLPTIYLINPDGIVIASNFELKNVMLEQTLKKYLK